MLKNNTDEFLEQYANCRDNIKRYKSYIKNKNRDSDKKLKDKIHLQKHEEKYLLMQELLESKIKTA